MYKNDNKTKYFIYDCISEKYITTCENFEELIAYIAKFNYVPWWSSEKTENRFLEDYNCTMKDTNSCCDYDDNFHRYPRKYVVFDSLFRIIDVRIYKEKILSYEINYKNRKWKNPYLKYYYEKNLPKFRNGPIPHTGTKYRRGGFYRYPRTFNEIRQNSIPEYKEFVRDRRKHLPTVWDDIVRGHSRSWKDQSKKRKQWM